MPYILIAHEVKEDERYYGPYENATRARDAADTARRLATKIGEEWAVSVHQVRGPIDLWAELSDRTQAAHSEPGE
jgi:hypothetical protein